MTEENPSSRAPKTKVRACLLTEPRTLVTPAMAEAGKEALLEHYLDLCEPHLPSFPKIASIVYEAMQAVRPSSDEPADQNR